ncbi:hypothetical protein M422DRAFT_277115 [Sphaerobolus stellatus SS14]|uniref:Uncharacterized protein n=1 Tax=Sphaerobolus stellatus (strain SS14) TaxID=990650 RepID=A0A0C9U095_SPHS4|nr:hypothetical protein M422DRAFT_277231 [Sphaerobolus stellatus SS14]KIJ22446.1 hypothetical protein M422DRAFT_277115 [Sphaerobolus stellatus SS14]
MSLEGAIRKPTHPTADNLNEAWNNNIDSPLWFHCVLIASDRHTVDTYGEESNVQRPLDRVHCGPPSHSELLVYVGGVLMFAEHVVRLLYSGSCRSCVDLPSDPG